MSEKRLGVGFIGSGFNAKFHMLGWKGVRDANVLGVWSPDATRAADAARYANELDVGAAKAYKSIGDMVADPAIDALWITGPNQARVENVEETSMRCSADAVPSQASPARNPSRATWPRRRKCCGW